MKFIKVTEVTYICGGSETEMWVNVDRILSIHDNKKASTTIMAFSNAENDYIYTKETAEKILTQLLNSCLIVGS